MRKDRAQGRRNRCGQGEKDCSPPLPGIYILQKIRNYANLKIQNGKTLPKLNIGIYSKFGQYYKYDITMYDFIHIIQFLIPIWSWISKMMLENETFFHFSFEMLLRLHSYLNLL